MSLIIDYEEIKTKEFFFLNIAVKGVDLSNQMGIPDRNEAYSIALSLKKAGFNPKITRKICYESTRSGHLTKDPEYEEINLARLERLMIGHASMPIIQEPIIMSTYRC